MKKNIISRIIAFIIVIMLLIPMFTVSANDSNTEVSPIMAKAYLNVLNNIINTYGISKEKTVAPNSTGLAYTELIDFNGDGIDELYLFYYINGSDLYNSSCIEEIWYFDGTNSNKSFTKEHKSDGSHIGYNSNGRALCSLEDGKVYLIEEGSYVTGAGDFYSADYLTLKIYEFDGLNVKEKGSLSESIISGKPLNDGSGMLDDKVYYDYELVFEGKTTKDSFVVEGASASEYNDYKDICPTNVAEFRDIYSQKENVIYAGSHDILSWEINDVKGLIDSLKNTAPIYSYKNVTSSLSNNDLESIGKAISESSNGKVTSIYKLYDGIYYIVVELADGNYGGAVVKEELNSQSEKIIKVENASNVALTQEALDEYVREMNLKPNIKIDYNETTGFNNITDYNNYLNIAIDSVDGIHINDVGKAELAKYIENTITEISTNTIRASNNVLLIKGKDIEKCASLAINAKSELQSSLNQKNIILNKDINIIIRLDGTEIVRDKPLHIKFDKSVLDKIVDVDSIMVLLGDNSYRLKITSESLKTIINESGAVNIQIEKSGDNSYNITFVNDKGVILDKLSAAVGFSFPVQSELATVLTSINGENDNWGGQYDPENSTIEFSTKYSGNYEILENEILIDDIYDRSDNQKKAIRFMVSKGYFELDDNLFKPSENLTRYDFTKALVSMFFALDKDVDTSFTDVLRDSNYYSIVASAEKDSIVEGFDDKTFKGDLNISKEQVIALCARTLADKKGYDYPENMDNYLNFADINQVSEWAKKDIALAVREGLIDGTGILNPKENIDRAESAEMFYNLFMLLYEPASTEFTMSESTSIDIGINKYELIIVACILVIIGIVIGFIILKKRKNEVV